MIEQIDGIANLPGILQVPEIDVFYVTHRDLAQSMGLLHD
jgi:2-keto-3-deoxy-L-rhamnonate aldolase RhmA